MTKTGAVSYISQVTGYGRRAVENKMEELERAGAITFYPDPGRKNTMLISRQDIEKVVQALQKPQLG